MSHEPAPRLRAFLVACPHCHEVLELAELVKVHRTEDTCEECGQWFASDYALARFCSRRCQRAAYNRRRRADYADRKQLPRGVS